MSYDTLASGDVIAGRFRVDYRLAVGVMTALYRVREIQEGKLGALLVLKVVDRRAGPHPESVRAQFELLRRSQQKNRLRAQEWGEDEAAGLAFIVLKPVLDQSDWENDTARPQPAKRRRSRSRRILPFVAVVGVGALMGMLFGAWLTLRTPAPALPTAAPQKASRHSLPPAPLELVGGVSTFPELVLGATLIKGPLNGQVKPPCSKAKFRTEFKGGCWRVFYVEDPAACDRSDAYEAEAGYCRKNQLVWVPVWALEDVKLPVPAITPERPPPDPQS